MALPKTPLYERVEKKGGWSARRRATSSRSRTSWPKQMSRLGLYRGYRWLVKELYSFRNYKRRTLEFLIHRGGQVHGGKNIPHGRAAKLLETSSRSCGRP